MCGWKTAALAVGLMVVTAAGGRAEDSNRNDVRADKEKDGWTVVWGKNFTEGDWIKGTKAIAESVAAENPGPFLAWFEQTLEENFTKVLKNLDGVARKDLERWLVESLKGKKLVSYKGLKIEAGFATYNRWERVVVEVPDGVEWQGIKSKVKMKKIEKKIPLPNWHQFYVRYKLEKDEPKAQADKNPAAKRVVVDRDKAEGWETFTLERDGGRVALKFHTGYLCAENGGGGEVTANRTKADGWEKFELVHNPGGTVSLKAGSGHWLTAEGTKLVANRTKQEGWEKFQLVNLGGGKYALKAHTGKFVCAE